MIGLVKNREELVEEIKLCGKSIIENAESIVGNEAYLGSLQVTIYVNPAEPIRINIDRDYYPHVGGDNV